MLNYLVYKHTAPNGKVYIGQTCQKLSTRTRSNGSGYSAQKHFWNAIKKYGWNNITHEVAASNLTKKEADWLENYLIIYYESYKNSKGYNKTFGGEGMVGYRQSEELRKKRSEQMRGNQLGKGCKHSAESIKSGALKRQKQVLCVETGTIYSSITEAAASFGSGSGSLCGCLSGRRPTFKGYHWEYIK